MFDINKFKSILQKRRSYIIQRINECVIENPEGGNRLGMDYEIQLFELDSIIDTIEYMENNDIP